MRRSRCLFMAATLVAVSASIALLALLAQTKEAGSISAFYVHDVLHVSLPYHAPRTGEGNLLVQVLDPEDGVVARRKRRVWVNAGNTVWNEDLALPKGFSLDDLV